MSSQNRVELICSETHVDYTENELLRTAPIRTGWQLICTSTAWSFERRSRLRNSGSGACQRQLPSITEIEIFQKKSIHHW